MKKDIKTNESALIVPVTKEANVESPVQHAGEYLCIKREKDQATLIVRFIMNQKIFHSCKSSLYYTENALITSISDKQAESLILEHIVPEERASVSTFTLKECVERLKNIPELQVDISQMLENNKYEVLTENGVYDVKNGSFKEQTDKLYTNQLNFNYKPNQTIDNAPVFKEYVRSSLGRENLECLLRCIGYLCTLLTEARKAFFFIGPAQCGKSLLVDVIEDGIGTENTSAVSFSKLGTEQSRMSYQGKLVNLSREASSKSLSDDDAFKSSVAGDKITGRWLYENIKEFRPYTKFVTAANFMPSFKRIDTAILDRIIPIYFEDRLKENVQTDFRLKEKLIEEKDVFFSMALDTLPELIKNGYDFKLSSRSKAVLNSMKFDLSTVEEFISERTILQPNAHVPSVDLYDAYIGWCSINGVAAEGRNTFHRKFSDCTRIIKKKIKLSNRSFQGYPGIMLCNDKENLYGQEYQDSHSSTQASPDPEGQKGNGENNEKK